MNKGEDRNNFKFGKDKLDLNKNGEVKEMDKELFNQYRECLQNFNINIGNDINEMIGKLFTEKKKPDKKFELKTSNKPLDILVYLKVSQQLSESWDNKVPDSEFTKSVQEFIYLYLHIFFLFIIIIISLMITGLISMFYLIKLFHENYLFL